MSYTNNDNFNKNINVQCPTCRKRFDVSYNEFCVSIPCGHFVHNTTECKHNSCKICGQNVNKFFTADEIKDIPELYQNYIDMISITKEKQSYSIWRKLVGVTRALRLVPTFCGFGARLFFDYARLPHWKSKWINIDYLLGINSKIIRILNIHISTENAEKLTEDNVTQRVIICNHSNFHDLFVMAKLEPLPFMASPVINKFMLGRAITRTYPHVIVENDVTSKMTEHDRKKYEQLDGKKSGYQKVVDFFKADNKLHNKLMICPEGMLSNAYCMTQFKSTAFKMGKVQPALIVYKQNVFNHQEINMLFLERVDVKIIIMDIIDTNGSIESIENIRKLMADRGGFKLSRVENRSVLTIDTITNK